MGQVFRSARGYCVAVNSNDHPPPHVHAYGKGLGARFKLDCENQSVEFWDILRGKWSHAHLNELGEEIAERLADCCEEWRRIYG
jgi:hypothetical protein